MDKQRHALERLIKEGANVLAIIAEDDPRWNDSHFSAALDRAAQSLGYTDHIAYIRYISDPDRYAFAGREFLPF